MDPNYNFVDERDIKEAVVLSRKVHHVGEAREKEFYPYNIFQQLQLSGMNSNDRLNAMILNPRLHYLKQLSGEHQQNLQRNKNMPKIPEVKTRNEYNLAYGRKNATPLSKYNKLISGGNYVQPKLMEFYVSGNQGKNEDEFRNTATMVSRGGGQDRFHRAAYPNKQIQIGQNYHINQLHLMQEITVPNKRGFTQKQKLKLL